MLHELKIEQQFADAVLEERKTFEVRKNDRGYNAGDTVRFTVTENGNRVFHPLNGKVYRIGYVLSGWGIEERFVAFSIAPVYDEESGEEGGDETDLFDRLADLILAALGVKS